MQIGLVGLPLAGKTTLFNLLTGSSHVTGFGGGDEVHEGSVVVPDYRIDYLAALHKPPKIVHARIQFKDIPGAGVEDGAARAARLLDEARNADALVQVVRAFCSEEINSLAGEPSPLKELDDFKTGLLLADMDAVEKRIGRLKDARKIKKDTRAQMEVLEKVLRSLEEERPVNSVELSDEEKQLLAGQHFLTEKPLILVVNIDEKQLSSGEYPRKEELAIYSRNAGIYTVEICAQVEMEIGQLPPGEREEFMADLGLKEPGLTRLARAAYEFLGLISFFTIGKDEVRAWTVSRGTAALQAAGKVHSDMERGFIRAEVVRFDDLEQYGSITKVKERGLFRLEGKEYLVRDGDIINFRFNV